MNKKFFEFLKSGLEESIKHQQGKINLYTESIEVADPINTKQDNKIYFIENIKNQKHHK